MDVRLALTGFGNVGRGVATILQEQGEEYRDRYGVNLILTGVTDRGGGVVASEGIDLLDLLHAKERHGSVAAASGGQVGLRGSAFLRQSSAQVLLEAASTNFDNAEPGWTYAREALQLGMDLVLASKGALVLHYDDLMTLANRHERRVLFAGTVGAPLPVLELADRVLIGSTITGFEGIVNATTNQILTSMEEGATYEQGLRRAQEIGVAETDPTLDVDGWDAAAKAVIIARAIFGERISLDAVEREGIRSVTRDQVVQAAAQGETIKLIARVQRRNGRTSATVRPERRPVSDTLGSLRNDQMGVIFSAEPLGRVTATVQATGGISTALTVLRDVVNLSRDRGWTSFSRP